MLLLSTFVSWNQDSYVVECFILCFFILAIYFGKLFQGFMLNLYLCIKWKKKAASINKKGKRMKERMKWMFVIIIIIHLCNNNNWHCCFYYIAILVKFLQLCLILKQILFSYHKAWRQMFTFLSKWKPE